MWPRWGILRLMVEYTHHSGRHLIRIADFNGMRTLRFERNSQSSMRLDDPYATDIEYVAYLHLTRAIVPAPARVLVLGLGGGTLVKQLWRECPDLVIDAVEIDPEIVAVAKEFFALPDDPRIRIHLGDGREFVETSPEVYDIIVVDAYDDGQMPRHLTTEEFMLGIQARLKPGGVAAYNIIGTVSGTLSRPLRSLVRTAGNVWRAQWLFTVNSFEPGGPSPENVIMLTTDTEVTEEQLLARIADRVGGTVQVPGFERFGQHLYRKRLRSGDVPILADERRRRRGR